MQNIKSSATNPEVLIWHKLRKRVWIVKRFWESAIKKDKGVAFLNRKNNLYNYIPKIGKEIKIETDISKHNRKI